MSAKQRCAVVRALILASLGDHNRSYRYIYYTRVRTYTRTHAASLLMIVHQHLLLALAAKLCSICRSRSEISREHD